MIHVRMLRPQHSSLARPSSCASRTARCASACAPAHAPHNRRSHARLISGYVSAPGAVCSHSSTSSFSTSRRAVDPLGECQRHPEICPQLQIGVNGRRAGGLVGGRVDVSLGRRRVAEEHERGGLRDPGREVERISRRRQFARARRAASRASSGRPARIDGSTDSMKSAAGRERIGLLERVRSAQESRARRCGRAAACLDASAQELDPGDVRGRTALGLEVVQDPQGDARLAARLRGLGGGEQAPAATGGCEAERTGPLVPLRGRDRAAAQADVCGEPLDGGGELLVRVGRGRGQVRDPFPLELRLDAGQRPATRVPIGVRRPSPRRTPPTG